MKQNHYIKGLEEKLANATRRILENNDEWEKFLTVSGRFINYPFHQQIQIYDQNPDAKAVAEASVWNRLGLWFKPGTHGYRVLDKSNQETPIVKIYHDIANVYVHERGAQIPEMWNFPKEHIKEIADRLECPEEELQEMRLWKWIEDKTEIFYAEELIETLEEKGVSFGNNPQIKEIPDRDKRVEDLRKFMQATIAYQVFARCGLDLTFCKEKNQELNEGNYYNLATLASADEAVIGYFGDVITTASKPIYQILRTQSKSILKEKAQDRHSIKKNDPILEEPPKEERADEKVEFKEEITFAGNYRIHDDHLGEGGPKEKFYNNIAAIKVLHMIEKENRKASLEEQEILSKYVGWGGLAEAFDETKENWKAEYDLLKTELSTEEYKAAKGSVLNAHYTSPMIIREIYGELERLGFEEGNILEPSCGIGNFFGMLPEKMNHSKLFGVELDSVSGRIARLLYPEAQIQISGYENTKFPKNFFDIIIGNVPFGDYKLADREYDKYNFRIHDYFIAKGLDQLRPGGIMAVVTSSGTMDKVNASARKYFAEKAHLLGAIRLPDHAFRANAGTTVTTDILFFQKNDGTPEPNPSWLISRKNILDTDPFMVGDIAAYNVRRWNQEKRRITETKVECKITAVNETGETYEVCNIDNFSVTYSFQKEELTLIQRSKPVYVCNRYFQEHPEMVLGNLTMESGPFGERLACKSDDEKAVLQDKIRQAFSNLKGQYLRAYIDEQVEEGKDQKEIEAVAADPSIKNFSFAVINGQLYFRRDSLCYKEVFSKEQEARIKGLVELKDAGYKLLNLELEDEPEEAIQAQMKLLNEKYDQFVEKYGRINEKENQIFRKDASSGFVRAYEICGENGKFNRKADIFSKRTVTPYIQIDYVETAEEALAASLAENGKVDLRYMANLMNTKESPETLIEKLQGIIFKDPEKITEDSYSGYVTADEYLSGNIRNKLKIAEERVAEHSEYTLNVEYLKAAMPKPLEASEIDVKIGSTWIEPKYIEAFMEECFQIPQWRFSDYGSKAENLHVSYDPINVEWHINNKRLGREITLAVSKYGTSRKNGLEILENVLNLRDTKVYDHMLDNNGNDKAILNKKETALCNTKAEMIKSDFESWIFKDPIRRADLVKTYNELFNSIRTRTFDGSFLNFPGMNPDVKLRTHQKNAVARTLFGGNTLLAHVVGAGKTYTMAASAMEAKRIGVAHKSLFVVPNHLTEQWGNEFLALYPAANILVAKKEDFLPDKRKTFCSKIATGDYDAIIIGHSQFERIPLSAKRQKYYIEQQIDSITKALTEAKEKEGNSFTVKQLQKTEKKLSTKLEKLNNMVQKDDVITFEQLGVDRLYVDESHYYKNLYLYTKMSNVAGVQQTEAGKSSDMYMKCQYIDELTKGKGIIFATGTPISNSMTELYTNMRYLQTGLLKEYQLEQFDAWAANFGNVVTAIELAPEGSGYRAKKRFSSFFNIPELMSMWHEAADVQTADMLNLPVPQVHIYNVQTQPSTLQREMVATLSERADAVRKQEVDPSEDNMLKITNDGRKLALDQRLIHADMPDLENSKINTCVKKAFEIWEKTKAQRSTQMIFCDLSTPKGDGSFNVYDDIRKKLEEKGVPKTEIAFIHEAKTELQKDRLFQKVRTGEVRFLLGSTFKMGAGTNVQDHLIALHHLDVPWRPSDIEQREGRIIRQGNQNPEVEVYRYVTADTFDAYSWQLIENKQKFISQIMTSKSPVRKCADIDDSALSYAEVKALATGNPYIKEKMELDISVAKLKLERAAFENEKYRLQDECMFRLPKVISDLEEKIKAMKEDINQYQKTNHQESETFYIKLGDQIYTDRAEAAKAMSSLIENRCTVYGVPEEIGSYLGFTLYASRKADFSLKDTYELNLQGAIAHKFDWSSNAVSNFTTMTRILNSMPERLKKIEIKYQDTVNSLKISQNQLSQEFDKESLYQQQLARLKELDEMLNISENADSELAASVGDQGDNLSEHFISSSISSWDRFQNFEKTDLLDYENDILPPAQIVEFSDNTKKEIESTNQFNKEVEMLDPIKKEDRFLYIVNGEPTDEIPFKQALIKLLMDNVLGGTKKCEIVHVADTNIKFVYKDKGQWVMPIEDIDQSFALDQNLEIRNIIITAMEKIDMIQIQDSHNILRLPFEQYAFHEKDNPWKEPETVCSMKGIAFTSREKELWKKLNYKCGYYLKPEDIQVLASGNKIDEKDRITEDVQKDATELLSIVSQYEKSANYIGKGFLHSMEEELCIE